MDLFPAPSLSRESFMARGLRVVPVLGDGMLPDLREGRDHVLVAPLSSFKRDGLYVVEQMGQPCIYRCQGHLDGQVSLLLDNPAYGQTPAERGRVLSRSEFEACVLGKVVCELKVCDAELMAYATAA